MFNNVKIAAKVPECDYVHGRYFHGHRRDGPPTRNLVLYVSVNNLIPREFSERPDGLLPVCFLSR